MTRSHGVSLLLVLAACEPLPAPESAPDGIREKVLAGHPPTALQGGAGFAIGAAFTAPGDVNGDGYADLLIDHSFNDTFALYLGGPAGLSPVAASTFREHDTYRRFFGAGDVNADGYADVVVLARGREDLVQHLGSEDGLVEQPRIPSPSDAPKPWLGIGAGDVDGDGFDDVVVVDEGDGFWLYRGSLDGLVDPPIGGTLGAGVNGTHLALAAGDLDGDGRSDVAFGNPDADGGNGSLVVFFGSATRLGPLQASIDGQGGGERFASDVTFGRVESGDAGNFVVAAPYGGAVGRTYVIGFGDGALQVRGSINVPSALVASGGDVDGAGFDDVAIGANPYANWQVGVHLGGPAGIAAVPDSVVANEPGTRLAALAGAGDINGDGFSDLVVEGGRSGSFETETVWVYYGGDGTNDGDDDGTPAYDDCDDSDATVHPGATEIPGDGRDSDCNGGDVCWLDADRDGWSGPQLILSADLDCADVDESPTAGPGTDCNDHDAQVHTPSQEIVGDGIDEDCDLHEACWFDGDHDGHRSQSPITFFSADTDCNDAPETLASAPADDCDDGDPLVHPGGIDLAADDKDQDCNGTWACWADADLDGWRASDATTVSSTDRDCTDPGEASAMVPMGDCNDAVTAIHPTAFELIGDEVDSDCDGLEICFFDGDDDGARSIVSYPSDDTNCTRDLPTDPDLPVVPASAPIDCDDGRASVHPGALDIPGDALDQDCDGTWACWADADLDGWRSDTIVASADPDCVDPGEADATLAPGDCADGVGSIHPGATEIQDDGIDQDCDGTDAKSPLRRLIDALIALLRRLLGR